MAEQLLSDGTVNEQHLKTLALKKAREDIGISLLYAFQVCMHTFYYSYCYNFL